MTIDVVNDYLKRHATKDAKAIVPTVPQMRLADGFRMSVQASRAHYSTPRETGADAYTAVEVGFPSERDDLLMPYAENPDDPTGTVYGWVPVRVLIEVIEKHGGLAN